VHAHKVHARATYAHAVHTKANHARIRCAC
jgi:hypothetical protein